MSYVKPPKHLCQPPMVEIGAVWQCDACGKRWKHTYRPYHMAQQTIASSLGIHPRPRRSDPGKAEQ